MCVYPKYGQWAWLILELTTYLYCGFWVSYYGQSFAWRPSYTLVFTNSSLPLTRSLSSLLMWLPPFLSSLPLYFSLHSPIYSSRWMEVLWLFLVISGNGGPIPSFLSGCSIGSGDNGIGTSSHLQKVVWQRYSPRQYWVVETWSFRGITFPSKLQLIGKGWIGPQSVAGSRLQVQWALGQASWHEARAHGLAGLGPYLIQGVRVMDRTPQGWGPRPKGGAMYTLGWS